MYFFDSTTTDSFTPKNTTIMLTIRHPIATLLGFFF